MYPTLFEIGPFTLHSFGLMAALGFLAALFAMTALARRGLAGGLTPDGVSQLLVMVMLGGAFGARFAYVAEHWTSEFAGRGFVEVFRFDKGGLMFYGGLVGAILLIALFSRIRRLPLVGLLDLCATALPLGHAFGRVGCFLNGCCYGRPTSCFLGVTYPAGSSVWADHVHQGLVTRGAAGSLPVFPSQLIEAAANLLLFAALFHLMRRRPARGFVSGVYLVSYAVIRFFTETLRGDPRMPVGPLSISQAISVAALLSGVAFLVCSRFASRRGGEGA